VDIHIDFQAGISMQGHSTMDIRGIQISMDRYPCFYEYQSLIIYALWIHIWITIDFYGYPSMDLLWILVPGKSLWEYPEN